MNHSFLGDDYDHFAELDEEAYLYASGIETEAYGQDPFRRTLEAAENLFGESEVQAAIPEDYELDDFSELAETLREVLSEEYASAPRAQLERSLLEILDSMPPAEDSI